MNSFLQWQSANFDIFNDVRANSLGGEQRQVVVAHERKLLVFCCGIVTHRRGADGISADAISSSK